MQCPNCRRRGQGPTIPVFLPMHPPTAHYAGDEILAAEGKAHGHWHWHWYPHRSYWLVRTDRHSTFSTPGSSVDSILSLATCTWMQLSTYINAQINLSLCLPVWLTHADQLPHLFASPLSISLALSLSPVLAPPLAALFSRSRYCRHTLCPSSVPDFLLCKHLLEGPVSTIYM